MIMDTLAYDIGYDRKTKEMIIFEYGKELGRFDYNMEEYCDATDVEKITIRFLKIFDDGELYGINTLKR